MCFATSFSIYFKKKLTADTNARYTQIAMKTTFPGILFHCVPVTGRYPYGKCAARAPAAGNSHSFQGRVAPRAPAAVGWLSPAPRVRTAAPVPVHGRLEAG